MIEPIDDLATFMRLYLQDPACGFASMKLIKQRLVHGMRRSPDAYSGSAS